MQKVNLYNGSLLPKKELLPILSLWITTSVAIVLTMGLWLMQWFEVNKEQIQLERLTNQKNEIQQQLTQLQSIVLSAEEKINAEKTIKKLQQQLQQQQLTSELIAELNKKQNYNYSGVLQDLSNIQTKQLWLTRINLNTDRLSLEGKTFESATVANMVTQLQQFPNTNKVTFSKVIIERETAEDRSANFFLYADNNGANDEN